MSDTFEALGKKLQTMLIISGVGNLSQVLLWLGIFYVIWPTSMNVLKFIAFTMIGANLSWFCASVFAWLDY